MQKNNEPLVKQNVMKLEIFILGRQRRERRDGIEIERKEKKGNRVKNLKSNTDTCLCLLFSFLKALTS